MPLAYQIPGGERRVFLETETAGFFLVSLDTCKLSPTICRLLADKEAAGILTWCDMEECPIVLLNNISTDTLRRLVDWMEYHVDHPVKFKPFTFARDNFSRWDINFFDRMDFATQTKIMMAANQLKIENLMHMVCEAMHPVVRAEKKNPGLLQRLLHAHGDFDEFRKPLLPY